MYIDVAATIAGMDLLAKRIDDATRQITADAAHIIQAASMVLAPVGTPGNSTNAPGDLKRSIDVTGPVGQGGYYEAWVGPTVIYGRQREMGGDIVPIAASVLRFVKFGTVYFRAHVYQHPHPYMKPGRAAALPDIVAKANERITVAIVGG